MTIVTNIKARPVIATHTQVRIWPNVVVLGHTPRWGRIVGYTEAIWFIVLSTLAYLPTAIRNHWRHECEAQDCAFIEIGVNGTRWLRW